MGVFDRCACGRLAWLTLHARQEKTKDTIKSGEAFGRASITI